MLSQQGRFADPIQTDTLLMTTWNCMTDRFGKPLGVMCVVTLPIVLLVLGAAAVAAGIFIGVGFNNLRDLRNYLPLAIAAFALLWVFSLVTYAWLSGAVARIVECWQTGTAAGIVEAAGWGASRLRFVAPAALLYGILVFVGLLFCFVPGLVVGFLGALAVWWRPSSSAVRSILFSAAWRWCGALGWKYSLRSWWYSRFRSWSSLCVQPFIGSRVR